MTPPHFLSARSPPLSLSDTANAPIFGIDAEGLVNEWNRKAAAITGNFCKEEVMGRSLVRDFITSELQDSVQEVLQKALSGEETDNFEFPLYTKDGRRVEVLLNAATRRNTSNAIVGVVGVGQDITDRKNAETRVSLLAADLRLLIDNANAPIIGIDAHGCVNEWNDKAAAITGFTKQEVTGRYLVRDFIIDDYKVAVNGVLQKALGGTETDNFEFPFTQRTADASRSCSTRRRAATRRARRSALWASARTLPSSRRARPSCNKSPTISPCSSTRRTRPSSASTTAASSTSGIERWRRSPASQRRR